MLRRRLKLSEVGRRRGPAATRRYQLFPSHYNKSGIYEPGTSARPSAQNQLIQGKQSMAANLTPQYLEAEQAYKKAATAEEKLACLKTMWTLLPKHKASEKMQADLKTKMSELREEVEHARRSPKKAGPSATRFPGRGPGNIVIVGAPNAGKSRLLTRLTRATPEVAAVSVHDPRTARRHDGLGRRRACSSSTRRRSPPTSWKATCRAWCARPTPPC